MLRASSLRSSRFPREGTGEWGGRGGVVYIKEGFLFFVFLWGVGGVLTGGRGSEVRRQVLWFLVPVRGDPGGR